MAISAIEPAAARGNPETVKRLCQRLNEIMTFAVNTGVIHHNPLAGIKDKFANNYSDSRVKPKPPIGHNSYRF